MEGLQQVQIPDRETAPFIFDISARVVQGGVFGLALGFLFFKRVSSRKFLTYYGAGFGLGMSYTQINYLQQKLRGIE